MPVELEERNEGKTLLVRVTGRLEKQDYEQFTPEVERLIKQHGKIRVLLETHDFHGWDAGALWDDIKFDVKHFNDIERLAIVGEKKWEKGMATFCKPFTTAKVRYFEQDQAAEAQAWIEGE
ncbi:MAG: STAS/SEC14 domain-containing protein [Pirellulaceae bacterium]